MHVANVATSYLLRHNTNRERGCHEIDEKQRYCKKGQYYFYTCIYSNMIMQYFRIVIFLTKVPKTFRIARLFGLSWVLQYLRNIAELWDNPACMY